MINNHLNISNFFNDYFLSAAERVNNNSTNKVNLDVNLSLYYLFQTFKNPFPNIKSQIHIKNRNLQNYKIFETYFSWL